MNNDQTKQVQYPKNTLELLKYIGKKIPERLLKALPMTIAFGVFGWLLHTYLLVFINQGFNPDTWLGNNILNVKGSLVSSTLLWTMFGAIIPMLISFFRRGGNPIKVVTSIVKMPFDIINKSKSGGEIFLPYMCFACALTLFCERVFSGITSLVAGGIIMSSVVAFVTGRGSIFIQILRMIVNDVQMFILKKQKLKLDGESIFMIVGASGSILLLFGLVRALTLPAFLQIILNYVWILLIVSGVILLFNKNKAPKQFMFFISFIGTALLCSQVFNITAFADDAGWDEVGGTLEGWLGSEGAFTAVVNGLAPAVGTLVGSYVSSILGGLFGGFGQLVSTDVSLGPDTSVIPPQEPTQTLPQKPTQPTKEEIDAEKARLKKEADEARINEEFDKKRQIEINKQLAIKKKALEDKKQLEKEVAAHKKYEASLCKKYNTTPDKLRDVLLANQGANAADAEKWTSRAKKLDYAIAAAQITVIACDTAIDGLANVTGPYGKMVRAGYKVTKGLASGGAEAYYGDGSVSVGAGMTSGLVKGGVDAASDYINSTKIKAGLAIGSEVIGGAITEGSEGALKGLKNGLYNVGVGTLTDKIGGGGYGNDTSLVTLAGGKTAVIIDAGGQTITRIVSNNSAQNFIKNKLINQGIQSGVKGASGLINEFGVKPALTNLGVLPK